VEQKEARNVLQMIAHADTQGSFGLVIERSAAIPIEVAP
jgi:hypothetical protein